LNKVIFINKHKDSGLEFLRQGISLWPNLDIHETIDPNSDLLKYLDKNFDDTDFFNKVYSVDIVDNIFQDEPRTLTIEFYAEGEDLQRAKIGLDSDGKWYLSYLRFQCPGCFGSGENMDTVCILCGGEGWGAT